jgi:hypothetical protein
MSASAAKDSHKQEQQLQLRTAVDKLLLSLPVLITGTAVDEAHLLQRTAIDKCTCYCGQL